MIKISSSLALALLVFSPLPAFADDTQLETEIVDTMNKVFGKHPGFRANHAKGVVAKGHFTGSSEAPKWSKAAIFDGKAVPVDIRFSDSTGVPNIPDGTANASPHGLSIKYHLADGSETDMVINSLHFFPVATGAEFHELLEAIAASPPEAAKPTKVDQFMAAHPQAPKALASVQTPDSFADEIYFGIDAFIFINKDGKKQAVRYQAVPEKIVHLDAAAAAKMGPDFLIEELPKRLAKGPVKFHLMAQLANPGDQTSDPSKPWPDDRKRVDLGVLSVEEAVPNSLEAQKSLLFLPGQLIDGIDVSDDALVGIRDGAYAVSFSRRQTP